MDLSAVIFVVLALAWAVYLIPKALKHHDELASDRLVEGHSDKVRILARHGKAGQADVADVAEVLEVEVEHVDTVERTSAPGRTVPVRPAPGRPITRASARKAAQRRRRVLGVLVVALVTVWALTWLAYLPIWAPAVPGALVALFLVVARLSVRSASAPASRRAPSARRDPDAPARTVAPDAPAVAPDGPVAEIPLVSQDLVDLLAEDTAGVPRQEIEAALADDGSLWDPLPVTLPTYVNKARARRTVRTIELTGINSSGHDQSDSVLAREAEQSTAEAAGPAADDDARRVAGA